MSTSGGSRRTNGNWQRGQEEDYWIFLPQTELMEYVPSWRSTLLQNPRRPIRDPWWLFEERFAGGAHYGLPSIPTRRSSQHLLLIDGYDSPYPRPRDRDNTPRPPPPQTTYYEPQFNRREESSKLSDDEQKQALNKLRKQLYSPHMSSIIKRLGSNKEVNSLIDDDLKKCAICLEDLESKRFVTSTPCNHLFHDECIVPWVKSQGKCPVCRYAFVEKNISRSGAGNNTAMNATSILRGNGIDVERDHMMSLIRSFRHVNFY